MTLKTTVTASDFLAAFEVYDVDPSGGVAAVTEASEMESIAGDTAACGLPRIISDCDALPEDVAAAMVFPIYRDGEIVSVVALAAADDPRALGVFEIWEPDSVYEEVRLTQGYYSKLERFENVSAFIRFDKGSGLPGSVWHHCRAVVHNDLPHHPGFLRAAGASAEELTTAIGIPIFDDDFVASVVLLSSAKSPLARGFEIWTPEGDGFLLLEGSYPGLDTDFHLPPGARLSADRGLPGAARLHGAACVSSDAAVYAAGRELSAAQATNHRGLALPYYDQTMLTSVVVLLF